ncbi:MAG: GDP-mannose 4,6-dehydratase [Candidatus Rokubacteria bacterium]|nr:GDP-mannose 4,6-dehydratase [Candidatus Rokubacteria bacterium]
MRLLITGITGFVGGHMAEYALAQGATVWGSRRASSQTAQLERLGGRIVLLESDLRDAPAVRALLEEAAPDAIVHLAAQSSVRASWEAPAETLTNNVVSQVNLLEAVRALGLEPRILVVGTSEEYGLAYPDEIPIGEHNPLRPLSPYALSKVSQDLMGYQYFEVYGLPIVRSRAFNHEGPGRSDAFMTGSFARQIAEIEAGRREPVILVGDLEPRRDYSDVRDIVRGYWLLLTRGTPGEVYNLCSGRSWAIRTVLDFLLERAHVRGIEVRTDPARLRPTEMPLIEGDPAKVKRALGWQVEIPFERTLADVLDYWRAQIRANGAR